MGRATSGTYSGKDGFVHADKVHRGVRLQRGGFACKGDAEEWLVAEIARINAGTISAGSAPKFEQAAAHYVTTHSMKLSLDTDVYLLEGLVPKIGALPLDQVHDKTLRLYIQERQRAGLKSKTINLGLSLVRRILNLAARSWRLEDGAPWLRTAPPLLSMLSQDDQREPLQLNWAGQRKLLPTLPAHLARMALFDLNTGARDEVVCNLRWEWELQPPGLGYSVFVVPKRYVKGRKRERVLVCNSVAQSVIEAVRWMHDEFVFVYSRIKKAGKKPVYRPIGTMNNTAWQGARIRAGWPDLHVHDLRHTVGMRLRESGVREETISDILWHVRKGMTPHYSVAQVKEIRDALELITDERNAGNVSLSSLIQQSKVPKRVPIERKTA